MKLFRFIGPYQKKKNAAVGHKLPALYSRMKTVFVKRMNDWQQGKTLSQKRRALFVFLSAMTTLLTINIYINLRLITARHAVSSPGVIMPKDIGLPDSLNVPLLKAQKAWLDKRKATDSTGD
jgi:hypothetical protein